MPRFKILFVCSKNQWRSPTAEAICRKDERISVRSRGTARAAVQTIRSSDIAWADAILVMEDKHLNQIHYGSTSQTESRLARIRNALTRS